MAYWNGVDIIDIEDAQTDKKLRFGPSEGMSHSEWRDQRYRNWAIANKDVSDDDIVDEIHTWLNEGANRKAADLLHYIGQAEEYLELLKARAWLQMEDEDEDDELIED